MVRILSRRYASDLPRVVCERSTASPNNIHKSRVPKDRQWSLAPSYRIRLAGHQGLPIPMKPPHCSEMIAPPEFRDDLAPVSWGLQAVIVVSSFE